MADVAMTYYHPFDAGNGANVTEEGWRRMARFWLPSGVIGGYANELKPFGDSSGLQAKVDIGACWVRGHYGELTGSVTMPLAAVGGITGGQERWDRLILRSDFGNNVVQIGVLTGTPGAPPAARPALTQSSSIWEELLADVGPLINTTTTVTAGMVYDGRWIVGEDGVPFYRVNPNGVSSVSVPAAGTIPSWAKLLYVTWAARSTNATNNVALGVRFNGDTASNYDRSRATLDATYASGGASNGTSGDFADVPGSLSPASAWANGVLEVLWPNLTTFERKAIARTTRHDAAITGGIAPQIGGVNWRNTAAAITLLTFLLSAGNFNTSTFEVKAYA